MNEQEVYSASTDAKAESNGKGAGKSMFMRAVIAVVAVLVIIGIAWMAGLFGKKADVSDTTNGGGDSPATLTPEQAAMAVATVNGVEISRGEFEKTLTNVRSTLSPESIAALENGALEQSVISDMVNMRLLIEEAGKKKIAVSGDDVQKEYDMFKESVGGDDVLRDELAKVGLDEAGFRENIKNELMVRALLDKETDIENISVTEAEILAIYEEAKAVAPEDQPLPPLEEVKDAARAQLTQQKSAEIINAYVQKLRAAAQVEITL